MNGAAGSPRIQLARRARKHLSSAWAWLLVPAAAALLPWLFYDFSHARHAGFVVSMLSQMGMMVIFALSYNMLMGQAGLLSFGHAVFFGFGGYCAAHLMTVTEAGGFPMPLELVPLLAGFAGLGLAIPFGFVATRQRAIAFAMITMAIGELMTAAAVMFHHFFGGEGGVTTDRQIGTSLFGAGYAQGIQVYYLILVWAVLATAGMRFLTATPLGRMANACRDNHERAQFVGYDPRMVRFLQFALSGFFAGVGGGLYAITYEIVTYDALAAPLSGNALLMAYIGGGASFVGPILGAVLITGLQSGLSLLSSSWVVYVGVLFIVMVTSAPGGLMGLIAAHGPIARAGRLRSLALPYLRLLVPSLLAVLGFVGVVELFSFLTIGAAEGKTLTLLGRAIDARAAAPWAIVGAALAVGGIWLRREARVLRRAWDEASAGTVAAR